MPLVDVHATPTRSMRRWFGASLGLLLLIVSFACWKFSTVAGAALMIVGALIAVVYYAVPAAQLPIIRAWQMLTFPVSWLLGHLLLGGIYFGILLPIAITLRTFKGHDPLGLRSDVRESFWIEPNVRRKTEDYFRQF